jgi:hypothetical protein
MGKYTIRFHDTVTHQFVEERKVETLYEAKELVRQKFPLAVFASMANTHLAWTCESAMYVHSLLNTIAFISHVD